MPVHVNKKSKALKWAVVFLVLILPSLCILAGWAMLFNLCVIGIVIFYAAVTMSGNQAAKDCTHSIRAYVENYAMKDKNRYLYINYTYGGKDYQGLVTYHEDYHAPEIGQEIGAYINPKNPEEVMLAIYKFHKPGWSNRTKGFYDQQWTGMLLLGGLFIAFGILFVWIGATSDTRFPNTAMGTVVEMEKTYSYSGTGTGHYEYKVWVEYKADGITRRSYANERPASKVFNVGDTVTVHYKTNDYEFVEVAELHTVEIWNWICWAVGIGCVLNGIRLRILFPKRCKEAEKLEQGIDYL